jgi:hypothetical protein
MGYLAVSLSVFSVAFRYDERMKTCLNIVSRFSQKIEV